MEFRTYSQQQVLSDPKLTNYILDSIIEHLSYIYGSDMDSSENRKEWIAYNLERHDPSWRLTVAHRGEKNVGFLITLLENKLLMVSDIQISRHARKNPFLLTGLFIAAFEHYGERFETIGGYINKQNRESQGNFLRFATTVTELKNGYSFEIDEAGTRMIKEKLARYHKK